MPVPRIDSDDEETPQGRGSPIPIQRGLFSDDEASRSSDDDGGRGHESQAEEDDGGGGRRGGGAKSGDKNTDDEEEEDRKREERRKKEEEKKKKPKGPVKRQMISEDMLTGAKGVCQLPEIFKDFQFGGKGKEKEDLNRVLAKLEHWIHLLHPKQPFDQSLQRIEFLGLKRKVVKTHLKKLRMGLINNFEDRDEIIDDDDGLEDVDIPALEADISETQRERSATQPGGGGSGPSGSSMINNAEDEFPDDDELMEIMNDPALAIGKENEPPSASIQKKTQSAKDIDEDEEMDIDMDDFGDDEDDDYLSKQLDAQLKRAAEAEAKANKDYEKSQTNLTSENETGSLVQNEADTMIIPTQLGIVDSNDNGTAGAGYDETILVQSSELEKPNSGENETGFEHLEVANSEDNETVTEDLDLEAAKSGDNETVIEDLEVATKSGDNGAVIEDLEVTKSGVIKVFNDELQKATIEIENENAAGDDNGICFDDLKDD